VNKGNKRYPKISHALEMIVLFWTLQIAFIAIGRLAGFPFEILEHPAANGLFNVLAIGFILSRGMKENNMNFRELFSFRAFKIKLLLPMIMIVAGTSILISEIDNLINLFLPAPAGFRAVFSDLISTASGSLLVIIVSPLTEEMLFRGLILRGFVWNYSVKKAIIGSAVIFGLFHLNPWQFIGAVILGIVFAWWYVVTRSLWPGIAGHALHNAIPLIMGLFQVEIPGYTFYIPGAFQFQPLWFDLLGLVLFITGNMVFNRMVFARKR